jgi:galactokinase
MANFFSPGRINLIGEHTDYNGGLALPCAINLGFEFQFEFTPTIGSHSIFSEISNEHIFLDLTGKKGPFDTSWGAYLAAALQVLENKGLVSGSTFEAKISGNLPFGAGLSASAALLCGWVYGLNSIFRWGKTLDFLADVAREAEHKIGIPCGLLDQWAVLKSKPDHLLRIDFLKNVSTWIEIPNCLSDENLWLIDSKVKHELANTDYSVRRSDCEKIAKTCEVDFISQLTLQDGKVFSPSGKFCDIHELKDLNYIQYITEENERVLQTIDSLQKADLLNFGNILNASHLGLKDLYQVSCPELDFLQEKVIDNPNVYGARMMGGGFGGCVLVCSKNKNVGFDSISKDYFDQFGFYPALIPVRISGGVHRITL